MHYHTKTDAIPKAASGYDKLEALQTALRRWHGDKVTRLRSTFVLIFWVLLFFVYALTAPPSISEFFSDALEFQLVVPGFGIAHPTGYPLYTLLGGIWSRLLFPFGNWAWRMNLFSALAGATSVTLLALLAQCLNRNKLSIPWAALLFAFLPIWWQQATIAEVYTLHLCFVAGILLIVLRKGGIGRWGELAFRTQTFLLIGLSLAHHRTTVLLLPGILIYWLVTQPAIFRPQRAWFKWAAALLAPLLLYLYLPIRAAQGITDLSGDYRNTWAGFLRHVLAIGYTNFFSTNPLEQSRNWLDWVTLFQQQFGIWVLIVVLIGLLVIIAQWMGRTADAGWLLIALVLVTNLIFAVNYKVADVEVFLLPVFFCVALFFEAGIQWLLGVVSDWKYLRAVLIIALITLIFVTADRRAALDRAQNWSAHNVAVAMAKTPFPPESRVIGLVGEMTALRYMQQAEGLGLNVLPIAADSADTRRFAVVESVASGHPTYLTRPATGIEEEYDFSGEGILVRVWEKGTVQLGPLPHPLDIELMDGALKLVGYNLQQLDQPGETAWQLTLDWQVQQLISQSLKLSLRWLDRNGSNLRLPDGTQGQDEFPLHQVSPTNHWSVGKTIRDVQIVRLPASLAPEATTLQVIVYDSATGSEVGHWQIDLSK